MTKPWIVRKIAADPHARRELLWLRAREKDDIALASDLEEIDPGLLDRLRAAGATRRAPARETRAVRSSLGRVLSPARARRRVHAQKACVSSLPQLGAPTLCGRCHCDDRSAFVFTDDASLGAAALSFARTSTAACAVERLHPAADTSSGRRGKAVIASVSTTAARVGRLAVCMVEVPSFVAIAPAHDCTARAIRARRVRHGIFRAKGYQMRATGALGAAFARRPLPRDAAQR